MHITTQIKTWPSHCCHEHILNFNVITSYEIDQSHRLHWSYLQRNELVPFNELSPTLLLSIYLNGIVPDYMILCPPDEGRYMSDEGNYTGTSRCASGTIWCLKHFIRAVIWITMHYPLLNNLPTDIHFMKWTDHSITIMYTYQEVDRSSLHCYVHIKKWTYPPCTVMYIMK